MEELEWQIAPGFIAVTGETGAGKSIIIGALQLLLGERADKSLIRTGADLCAVEAAFSGDDLQKLNPQLVEGGIEPCENDLILKRTLSSTGTNRQFINGSPTTLSVLKNLGDKLVDLHGPHDHQSLLSPETQLSLLDSFARAEEQLEEYRKYYRKLQTLVAEHTALNTAETAREQELDLLHHQITEIKSADLVAGEEEEIENCYKLASNSKRLIELASAIANKLSEADGSVLSQLAETQRLLRELEKIDSSIAQFSSAIISIARTTTLTLHRLRLCGCGDVWTRVRTFSSSAITRRRTSSSSKRQPGSVRSSSVSFSLSWRPAQ